MFRHHVVNAVCSRKMSVLLTSAAFVTIYHNILITQLSLWFVIHDFLLSSHCFCINCDKNFSSTYTCLSRIPQGSDVSSLLFVVFTFLLSTLSLTLSLNYSLYADGARLSSSLSWNAVQQISCWLTANLFTVSSFFSFIS